MSIPITDLGVAEYQLKSDSANTYLLVDTCTMEFIYSPSGTFTPQSLRKIQLLINGELRMMQMFLPPGNIWQFYPNQYLGFPQGERDSALLTFVCEIPDTTTFFPQSIGEYLRTKLTCRYHFASNTGESFETNTATGQTITISSIVSSIEEIVNQKIPASGSVGQIFIFDAPLWVIDITGRVVVIAEENGVHNLSPGIYLWEKKTVKGIITGRITVY